MANGRAALHRPQRGLVEHAAHQAQFALHHHVLAIAHGDAGALLAAVLQCVQAEEGDAGHLVSGCDDAENPALLLGVVALFRDLLHYASSACGIAPSHTSPSCDRGTCVVEPAMVTSTSSPPTSPITVAVIPPVARP